MALHLVFLLEEPSAGVLLNEILPRVLPSGVSFQVIPHDGKQDLRKSLTRKLKAWNVPSVRFVVLHDQDSDDCRQLKQDLLQLCRQSGRDDVLIRIVCRELEAWYFGDLQAVEQAFKVKGLQALARKQLYRDSDAIPKPSHELKKLVAGFNKGLAAQAIPRYMDIKANSSPSFQHFIKGVKRLCAEAA